MINLIKRFTKKQILVLLLCTILIVFQVWLDLKLPDYMSKITALVQTGGSVKEILIPGSYMLLCALGSLALAIIVGYFITVVGTSFSKIIRKKVFSKVEEFGMEEINKFSTSSLITRTTNDITQVEMFVSMGFQIIIKAPIMATWAIFKILNKSWQWSAVTGGAVVILIIMVVSLMIIVLPKFKIVQKLIDNINSIARENLMGIRVVRAFNAENYQKSKFEDANNSLTKTQLFNQKTMSIMSPIMNLVMHGLTLSIYFIGAYLINGASMGDKITIFSNMIVFSSYAMQVIMSFLLLALIFIMWPRASVSATRINEVLMTSSSIKDGEFTTPNGITGEIEFKKVSFKYPDADAYILKNISFKVNKGETVAFIGSTGSGKSTLVNLVMRFYDVTDGEILVDGVNVKDYKQEYLYNKLGYVSQKAIMFNGSVNYNVAYGKSEKKITHDKIEKAIEVAQGTQFVSKLPDGYSSSIAQGGTNISGGQKQRISIARAIARDPEIYIFDDSFSALDYKTDYKLRSSLKKYTADATCLIVAQRIGTILNADKIIVLENGKCVGMGTHKELLENCRVYQEIAYSQLSKEELLNA